VSTKSPVDVLESYYDAVDAEEWAEAAALYHPEALTYFVRRLWLRSGNDPGPKSGESELDAAAEYLRSSSVRTRYAEWTAATIARYPKHESEILARRFPPEAIWPRPRFVGHIVDDDTAYVVRPAWEPPPDDPGYDRVGLRITPRAPDVLRLHAGAWRIATSLAEDGVPIIFAPIRVEVDGTVLELRPHEDEVP